MKGRVKKLRLTLVVVAALGCATAAKVVWNELTSPKVFPPPCGSSAEAKRRGTWVCDVRIEPKGPSEAPGPAQFPDAWVEEVSLKTYWLVWFPYYEKQGRQYLCFIQDDKHTPYFPEADPFHVLEGHGGSFGYRNGVYFDFLEERNSGRLRDGGLTMRLLGSWKEPPLKEYSLKAKEE